jgi:O-antigen ligase
LIAKSTYGEKKYFFALATLFVFSCCAAVLTAEYWIAFLPFAALAGYAAFVRWPAFFFVLIASLPWSIEYNFNDSLGTDFPDEPLMLVTALVVVSYALLRPRSALMAGKHPLIMLVFAAYTWIFVSVIFSTDWLVSAKYLLAKCWYFGAFGLAPLLLFNKRRNLVITGLVFLASMFCVTLLVLCRHAQFNFEFAHINDAVSPFFRNHVNYSAMLVCTVPVLVAIIQVSSRFRKWALAGLIVVAIALVLSYARGGWLAAFVGTLSYWALRKKKLLLAYIATVLAISCCVWWIKSNDRYLQFTHDYRTTIFHTNFREHLISTYELKDVSTAERFNRWIAGARMAPDNLLTGFGPNTFYGNYQPYTIPAFRTWVSNNTEHSTVHNYFLLLLIEQGIPGLLFFLGLTASMIYYAEKLYARVVNPVDRAAALACGVMLMMILTVNFLSDLVETDKVGSLFFLCLAALVSIDLRSRKTDRSSQPAD